MSRRDIREAHETPEEQGITIPEKRINTYDDLGTSDSAAKIKTYDDLRGSGNEKSINTYDDLQAPNDGTEKTNAAQVSDFRNTDGPEMVERRKIDQVAEGVKNIDKMKPEQWKTLSLDDKKDALEYSGKELGRAYNSPEPPLETKKIKDLAEQGEYGDGYSYDVKTNRVVGSDYGIRMNEDAISQRNERLFGDDPKAALGTYSHEFRHSYQLEQAHAYQKGFRVDNAEQAKTWSENFKDYKQPPDAEMAKTDPERYFKEYDSYRNQPVEKDAREFAGKVTDRVYG